MWDIGIACVGFLLSAYDVSQEFLEPVANGTAGIQRGFFIVGTIINTIIPTHPSHKGPTKD